MAHDHPLYRLLHDEFNPKMISFVFRETLMTHLLLWGNAYAQIIRNGKNEIVALYPLMPNKMSLDRDKNGWLYYTYYRGSNEAIKNKNFSVTLHPSDVLHIPGLGFDGLIGYSRIGMGRVQRKILRQRCRIGRCSGTLPAGSRNRRCNTYHITITVLI